MRHAGESAPGRGAPGGSRWSASHDLEIRSTTAGTPRSAASGAEASSADLTAGRLLVMLQRGVLTGTAGGRATPDQPRDEGEEPADADEERDERDHLGHYRHGRTVHLGERSPSTDVMSIGFSKVDQAMEFERRARPRSACGLDWTEAAPATSRLPRAVHREACRGAALNPVAVPSGVTGVGSTLLVLTTSASATSADDAPGRLDPDAASEPSIVVHDLPSLRIRT